MTRGSLLRILMRCVFGGLVGLAVGIPTVAWVAQNDPNAFNKQVGWANIWALPVAVLGLLVSEIGKKRKAADELDHQVIALAKAQRSSHGEQLAQLLGTDSLESRPAKLTFSVADVRTGKPAANARVAGSVETVADYYKMTSGRMLILGVAGAGKTVIGNILLMKLIEDLLGSAKPAVGDLQVPVIFNLTSWSSGKKFDEWLADEIAVRFHVGLSSARKLVRENRILPLLDGLDEMDNELEPPDRANWAVQQLNDYIAVKPHGRLVLMCRSGSRYYSRLRIKIRNMQAIAIKPLRIVDIDSYILEHCGKDVLEALKEGISGGPRGAQKMFYTEVATPWRLAMTVGYINVGNDVRRLLPRATESQAIFANRLNSELYETFLSTRLRLGGCKNHRQIGQARHSLSRIAHLLHSPENGEQSTDIILHDWWQRFGGKVPAWQVRAAAFAAILPFGLPLEKLPLEPYSPDPAEGWLSWALPLANFMMLFTMALATPSRAIHPTGISLSRLLSSAGLMRTVIFLVASIALGITSAQVVSWPALGVGLGIGCFILLVSVVGSRMEATEDAMDPHAPLRRDFFASVIFGAGMGIFMGTYMAEVLGPSMGLRFGLGYFLTMTVGFASGRYFIATFMGPTVGLPRRLSSYLRWAKRAGILRVSGISYQFRHRELMNYLLDSSEPPPKMPIPGPFGIPIQRWPRWGRAQVRA